MKTKIKLHSVIDLITNSSTEIYTYSTGSLLACTEMVNEFLKTIVQEDHPLTCDDLFELSIETEEANDWSDYSPQSFLIISPKKPEYSNLAILIRKFLYSTDHEAEYNG